MYPCQNKDPSILLLPALSRATAFLTLPVLFLSDDPEEQERLANPDCDGAEEDSRGTKRSEETSSMAEQDYDSASNETSSGTSMIQPEDRRHPFSDVHLLWPLRPHSHVPLALICVAEGAEIYSVMSSALMQRRTFQITDPLLAFVLSPDECTLQLVIGWVEEHPTHQCVRVFANLWPSL